MILVTAAGGKTGRTVIEALVRKGASVRAFVHRKEHVAELRTLGAAEVVVGDLRDRGALEKTMAGAEAVYHICPPVQPDEAEIGEGVLAAAQAAGVGHFVYHSAMHPQIAAMPHHAQKLRVERAVIESDLPFTILQPASYMQNMLGAWEQIARQGVYVTTYGLHAPMSLVDLEDVGEVAAIVLTAEGHRFATYELSGPEVLDAGKMAAILSDALGRPVTTEALDVDQWEARVRTAGFPEYSAAMLATMFRYYAQHGFTGNPNVLGWLLGRPATTFAQFVARVKSE